MVYYLLRKSRRIGLWCFLSLMYLLSLYCSPNLTVPEQNNFRGVNSNITVWHHHDMPPVYWINLDSSVLRRETMSDILSLLGISDTHRVPASDKKEAMDLWQKRQLIFHPKISLEEMDANTDVTQKHSQHIYSYHEAACLLSHLKSIKQTYDAGHELALIIEDDAVLTNLFQYAWFDYVKGAPAGWKILQFSTNNPTVMKHAAFLREPFFSWQPYHWSTRAYMINKAGMKTLIDLVHSSSGDGSDVWRFDKAPMVVADEVIYAAVGHAYTSTGLWIDSLNFDSTVQSRKENPHVALSYLPSISGEKEKEVMLKAQHVTMAESILILSSVRVHNEKGLESEIRLLQLDNLNVCKFHHRACDWEVSMVVTNSSLLTKVEQLTTIPPNLHLHIKDSPGAFNRYSFIENFVDKMKEYDMVLLKDNDMRLSGFPWYTFVQQRGNAVISGPLRQKTKDACQYGLFADKQVWTRFYEANQWCNIRFRTSWSSELFTDVVPTEVPILEQSFVLFDAKFAHYFFSLFSKESILNQAVDWLPDWLWCQAAKEWGNGRKGCHLVPVVSRHEDSNNINTDSGYNENRQGIYKSLGEDINFQRWMKPSFKWNEMIGNDNKHIMLLVDRKCRSLLGVRGASNVDLQLCIDTSLKQISL